MNDPTTLEPFPPEPSEGYLADSQFDFPESDTGWSFRTLDLADATRPLHRIDSLRDTATPLVQMVGEDPFTFLGRDTLHVGHRQRPCVEWSAPCAGRFRLEGEVSLLRAHAFGGLTTTVLVDDEELLSQPVDHPQELRFIVEISLQACSRVRVLFSCRGQIDNNHALYYLRVARGHAGEDATQVRWVRSVHPDWQRLGRQLAFEPRAGAEDGLECMQLLQLSRAMYGIQTGIDPRLVVRTQAMAAQDFEPHFRRLGQPRYFAIKPSDRSSQVP